MGAATCRWPYTDGEAWPTHKNCPTSTEEMGQQVLGTVLPHGMLLLGLSLAGPSWGFVVVPSRRGAVQLTEMHQGAAGGRDVGDPGQDFEPMSPTVPPMTHSAASL